MHQAIQFKNVGLSFPHKICFQDFNAEVRPGQRIALIGVNGSGKSSLIKMLLGKMSPSEGEIMIPNDVHIADVPQVIEDFNDLSGGQRFNKALSLALSKYPNVLLLDEPTNHLDASNKKSLIRMLSTYPGSLVIASHDLALLRTSVDTFWHIDEGQIHVFTGSYDDYMRERAANHNAIETELATLQRQKKDMHQALMKEQVRAKKSQSAGEKHIRQRKWPTVVSSAKAGRSQETSGQKKKQLQHKKETLLSQLSGLRTPEVIEPTFSFKSDEVSPQTVLSISGGSIGYDAPIFRDIYLSLSGHGRLAIMGDNGSGKSTLAKAILSDPSITKTGEWILPRREEIGYLDQHYANLDPNQTVLETIQRHINWSHADIRRHLNTFLFRKNEEVNAKVAHLSGGEKARLALAEIAAHTPKLLILDEITNNIDLETKNHVIEVLQAYPGALIVISHDEDFLNQLGLTDVYDMV